MHKEKKMKLLVLELVIIKSSAFLIQTQLSSHLEYLRMLELQCVKEYISCHCVSRHLLSHTDDTRERTSPGRNNQNDRKDNPNFRRIGYKINSNTE